MNWQFFIYSMVAIIAICSVALFVSQKKTREGLKEIPLVREVTGTIERTPYWERIDEYDARELIYWKLHDPELFDWKKRYIEFRNEQRKFKDEYDNLIPDSIDTMEKLEAFIKEHEGNETFTQKVKEFHDKQHEFDERHLKLIREQSDLERVRRENEK